MLAKKTFKTKIIEKYIDILTEFFTLYGQSGLINETSNILCTGITTIHRVFEYVFIKTQSLEKTIYYAQKASYYYLEYMEQISQTISCSVSLNQTDAILFVYKKTIFDLYDGENNTFNTMTDIMSLNEEILPSENTNWTIVFPKILKFINVLLFWNNDLLILNDRTDICNIFLLHGLLNIENMDVIVSYLEIIQQKILVNREPAIYKELLIEIIDKLSNNKQKMYKNKYLLNADKNDVLMKFYIDEQILIEKFDSSIKDFVNYIIVMA